MTTPKITGVVAGRYGRYGRVALVLAVVAGSATLLGARFLSNASVDGDEQVSRAASFEPPAGLRPTSRDTLINGVRTAILPNGRFVTPLGVEVDVGAPKPFGMDVSADGRTAITINSGTTPFSVTLIRNADSSAPTAQLVKTDATFMGVALSPDGKRFYASGGDNGNVLVGDATTGAWVGSVNLNGSTRPFTGPYDPTKRPGGRQKGAFLGNMALSADGAYLYIVDQGAFAVHAIDTRKIATGVDATGFIVEPNNFGAVASSTKVGRYPFGVGLSPDGERLLVAHVGIFQYTHLMPANPTGNSNIDYPLCYPATSYPDDMEKDKTITIRKVDPKNLAGEPLQDPNGIRCGYIPADVKYTVPGLGSPNAPEASSVYVMNLADRGKPKLAQVVKTGPRVGDNEDGLFVYSGSHPNAVAFGKGLIYVSNGNNDTVSVLSAKTLKEVNRIKLSVLRGRDRVLKGLQPMSLALDPAGKRLYVAEPGLNAVAVVELDGAEGEVEGLIPAGWWPAAVKLSADGKRLYVANARGRGSLPNNDFAPDNLGSPRSSTLGTVNVISLNRLGNLEKLTDTVLANNGLKRAESEDEYRAENGARRDPNHPVPNVAGVASRQIKHVIFINKENATHDLILGDITVTRKGVPVEGEPRYSLGADASPNHHELALAFAFGDNFYLEPSVSSDGHRWLTNTYTADFEETHWPASYGGRRGDAGDDPAVFVPFPGRLGFTDANSSPAPEDYNQHGTIFEHLERHKATYFNFGNGYEFAQVDEDEDTEPTGIRNHVNVPMQKTWREHSDHLYPEYNTGIPDAPIPGDPTRFTRFGRFKQVFEDKLVDRKKGECKLPQYTDLYYPNDHGGGSFGWSFKRYVQDNDAALGLTVELISNSPCWKDTVIFVVEDDTQNGFDHVDGGRSIFLAISPWVKRNYVLKKHVSLESVFKTANQILGLPPLNLYDAMAADMRDIFTSTPDFTPYTFAPVQFASAPNAIWNQYAATIDFSRPDKDEMKLREAILKSEGLPRVMHKHQPWIDDPKGKVAAPVPASTPVAMKK